MSGQLTFDAHHFTTEIQMKLRHMCSIDHSLLVICVTYIATVESSFIPQLCLQSLGRYQTNSHQAVSAGATTKDTAGIIELLKHMQITKNQHIDDDVKIRSIGQNYSQLIHLASSAAPDRVSLLSERPKLIAKHLALAEYLLQPDAFVLPARQWLLRYLKLDDSDMAKMQSRWSTSDKQIQNLGRYRLKEWFGFFMSQEIGLTHTELQRMIVSRPILLSYKLSNIQSTTSFFCEEVGLSKSEFRSIIKGYPSVLTYSIANRLRPHIEFLQNDIGGGKDNWKAWKKIVCSYPQFFSHSLEKTLLPKLKFFCDKNHSSLRLLKSELSQVVAKFPPTLWLSDENLIDKIDYLLDSLDLSSEELRGIVVAYPQLLGLSLENNLKPKIQFFLGQNGEDMIDDNFICDDIDVNCGLTKEELKEFVLYQPALLAYSLEGRIKPRIQEMKSKNISFLYSPKNVMSYTDSKFENWYELSLLSYTYRLVLAFLHLFLLLNGFRMSSQADCWTIVD